jgi:hypothetical protein
MDTDGNGTIEWDEFVDFMANPPPDAFKRPKNPKSMALAVAAVRVCLCACVRVRAGARMSTAAPSRRAGSAPA